MIRDGFFTILTLIFLFGVNLIIEIERVLNNLKYNLKTISIDKVLDRMGFPPNWKDIADIEIGD